MDISMEKYLYDPYVRVRSTGMSCCIPSCKKRFIEDRQTRSTFAFPKDAMRCSIWLDYCKCENLKSIDPDILHRKYRLCSLHFEDKMFGNYQKNRLKPEAVPTLFNNLTEDNLNVEQLHVQSDNSFISDNTSCSTSITGDGKMFHNCMVCLLSSEYNKDLPFHEFPKDEEKRRIWANALGIVRTTDWQYVCGNHFSDNSYVISNHRKILKPDAIPFSNEIEITQNQKDHSQNNLSSKITDNIYFDHNYSMPCSPVLCASQSETSKLVNDSQNCSTPKSSNIVETCENTPCLPIACTTTLNTSNIENTKCSSNILSIPKQKRKELSNDNTSETYPKKKRIWSCIQFGNLFVSDFETTVKFSTKCKVIEETIEQLRNKNKNLCTNNKLLQEKVSTLTDMLTVLKKKLLLTEIDANKLEALDSDVLKCLVKNVVTGKKESYTNEIKQFSKTLHFYSPKAYCYVRKSFGKLLPHPQTLHRLC